jgi:dihydropyrimidinase
MTKTAQTFDLAIRGGTIVTASDRFEADIGVRDGRIVSISDAIADAEEVVDATGLLVLPGGIDSHVHLSQPTSDGTVMADDFESGTRAAAAGGTTTVMPFVMQIKGF